MGRKELLIHFQPGARGDFLASVLLDSFVEKETAALYGPVYFKIHHIGIHDSPNSLDDIIFYNGIKIRIDPCNNPASLIEIEANHFIKNHNRKKLTNDDYDVIYTAAARFLLEEQPTIQKELYQFWIDFQDLKDVEFLKDLYIKVNNQSMENSLLEKIVNNLSKQPDITKDPKLVNLVKLLGFEIENGCVGKTKYFNYLDNLENIDKYLDVSNYQKD